MFREELDFPVITRCPAYVDSSLIENVLLTVHCPNHPLIAHIEVIVSHLHALQAK